MLRLKISMIIVYSSSDNENVDPISKQEQTPKKNTAYTDFYSIRQVRDGSTTASDSEDNLPLSTIKTKKVVNSQFQELIPTPNLAVVKQNKPIRKAINYKARIVTKDLFAEKANEKHQREKETNNEHPQQAKKKKKRCLKHFVLLEEIKKINNLKDRN